MTGARRALIVANDRYDNEGLRRLQSPAADAEALGRVLGDPAIGGFEVRVVRDEPAHVVSGTIEDMFTDASPDDVLLLHFSCHGLKSESGELFFAARNTRPERLGSTAISADFVQRCMRASRSRSVVLLLDCCYGGAFSRGVSVRATGDVNVLESFPGGRLGGGRGRAVITASNAMEYAFEGDRLSDGDVREPSVFTSALVEGLATGEADRDEDGWVSLNELYDYVFDRVRQRNPHQTPSRDVEMQGELYLARSQRRRVRPQPIPADLRAAMTDANMFSRLGAVAELRSRMLGDNLPVAAGAYEALAEVAGTDIRYVAEAASAALAEAAVRPAEEELRFAPAGPGEVHTLRLLGPPLARAITVRTSDAWIRVEEVPAGLAVSAHPGGKGTHRGSLVLRGPAGEVVIPVEAQVVAAAGPGGPAAGAQAVPDTVEPVPGAVESLPGTAEPDSGAAQAVPDTVESLPGAPEPAPGAPEPAPGGPVPDAAESRPGRAATGPSTPDTGSAPVGTGSPRWPRFVAAALLGAGVVIVPAGMVVLAANVDVPKLIAVTVVLWVYAATWALVTAGDRDSSPFRRSATGVLAVLAVVAVLQLLLSGTEYLDYSSIRDTPLSWFFLVAGAVEVFAAVAGGPRPTRALELASGCIGVVVGLMLVVAVQLEVSNLVSAAIGAYCLLVGMAWTIVGVTRRRALR